jgi:hypothetical protein
MEPYEALDLEETLDKSSFFKSFSYCEDFEPYKLDDNKEIAEINK